MICAPAAAWPVSEREHGPEDRERCEDGADDHPLKKGQQTRESVGRTWLAQSRSGAAASVFDAAVSVLRFIAALLAKQHAFLVSQKNPTTAVQPRGVRPESKSTFSRLPFSYFAG